MLAGLLTRGAITPAEHAAERSLYRRARSPRGGLGAAQQRLLRSIAADSDSLARRGLLAARRTPVMRTLEANLLTLGAGQAPAAYGARRRIGSSPLIWQFYPASGWQVQPLGNWGEVNGLLGSRSKLAQARALADELLTWAVPRAGGLAFEYYFPWDGAPAGWVSAMPTASAMKALAILEQRTGQSRYGTAARRLGPLLAASPPNGVGLRRGAGRLHLLLYSQSPRSLVGNGFASAISSLYDYVQLTNDPDASSTLEEAIAEADVTLRRYDTGAWSRYAVRPEGGGAESDLHYHRLFTEFLNNLCRRLDRDPYCSLARRFKAYETQPVGLGPPRISSGGGSTVVRFTATKTGSAKVSAWRGDAIARIVTVRIARGTQTVTLPVPRVDRVKVEATSLTGRTSSVEG